MGSAGVSAYAEITNVARRTSLGVLRALMEEATPPDAYRSLTFPVLVLQGEHAPTPTRMISRYLADLLPIAG